jgi:hypothetical protein
MANELLTTLQLKSIKADDVGRILSDGGGLRGRAWKIRRDELFIHLEYKYRSGSKWRTVKVAPRQITGRYSSYPPSIQKSTLQGIDPIKTRRDEKLAILLSQPRA